VVLSFPRPQPGRSVEHMPSYLVETYLARDQMSALAARERRAHSAAQELTEGTTRVRFDRSIHVPEDEICFYVFDAPSAHDAEVVLFSPQDEHGHVMDHMLGVMAGA